MNPPYKCPKWSGGGLATFPHSCPHCDAGPGPYVNSYLCGTYLRAGVDHRKHQTKRCLERQRDALAARVRELEAEVSNLRDQVACATDLLQRETMVHNALKEENAKRETWIADLDEIGRHTGKTDDREWNGEIGWLYKGQVAYVGEEKP